MSLDGRDDGAEGFPLSVYHSFPLQPPLAYHGYPKALVSIEGYYAAVTKSNGGANAAVSERYEEDKSVGRLFVASL